MDIEEEIFKKAYVNFDKLKTYGFKVMNDKYNYSKEFFDNQFKALIDIDIKGNITGKVIDLQTNEEYTNIRFKNVSCEFVNNVKKEYKRILNDIKINCFNENYFLLDQSNRVSDYIINKYHDKPEFLWKKFDGFGVFRNKKNNKWYGIIMNIDKSKLNDGKGKTEIINVKLDSHINSELLNYNGYYKAYHMNSKNWISIILDDTISDEVIFSLIDQSYNNINCL